MWHESTKCFKIFFLCDVGMCSCPPFNPSENMWWLWWIMATPWVLHSCVQPRPLPSTSSPPSLTMTGSVIPPSFISWLLKVVNMWKVCCVKVRERESVCVCVRQRERKRGNVCVVCWCVLVCVCMCVCVCVCERERESVCRCLCMGTCLCICALADLVIELHLPVMFSV